MPYIDFIGKSDVRVRNITHELDADVGKSCLSENGIPDMDGSLIVHGDNLYGLKALMPRYEGKVNCVYVDPPYNTGNKKFRYRDHNTHDRWLCMMWPRLQLLRKLLAKDGVIFISIDDTEQHRLRMMMDEIFGEDNFVRVLTWVKRDYSNGIPTKSMVAPNFEYVICYKKDEDVIFLGQPRSIAHYKKGKDGRMWCGMSIQATGFQNNFYTIVDPETGRTYHGNWAFAENTIKKMILEKRIIFPNSSTATQPTQISYADEKNPMTPILSHLGKFDAQASTKEFDKIFGKRKAFDFPKPVELLKFLFHQSVGKDAVILDSFAGSGTTAHAALALNKEDGGNRKFILVECEDYADGITAERIRRVIKGVSKASDESLKNGLGGTFTYCTLGKEYSQ